MARKRKYKYQVGSYYFKFHLIKQWDGEVRIFIKSQPDYGYRDTDLHKTHRLGSYGNYYVCVLEDLKPTNFADAKDWARYWAKGTAQYLDSGTSFS